MNISRNELCLFSKMGLHIVQYFSNTEKEDSYVLKKDFKNKKSEQRYHIIKISHTHLISSPYFHSNVYLKKIKNINCLKKTKASV